MKFPRAISGPYRRFQHSMTGRKAAREAVRYRDRFASVDTYCMFIGYPRSGHSMVGSLMDAHPDMVISNELDALRYIELGFDRDQIFYLILENTRQYAEAGRSQTGYSYTVPNQHQGTFRELKVIGDKKGGSSTFHLRRDPTLLDRLGKVVGKPVKFIHVTRNPYDNITTMATRSGKDLDERIETYFKFVATNATVRRRIGKEDVLDMRLEDFIADPASKLRSVCGFLSLDAPDDYIGDAAGIVYSEPKRTRKKIEWTDEQIAAVGERIDRYDFLKGYAYES